MSDALRAEWTKLRTAPATPWTLIALVVTTAGLSLYATASVTCPCATDTMTLTLSGIRLGQAVAAVFAIGLLGGEYGTGMITTTLTALPGRSAVLAAKATLATGLIAVCGGAGITLSYLAGRVLLGDDLPGSTLRPVVGSVLYLVLVALLGLGVTAVTRSSAGATGVVLGLLYVFPIVGSAVSDPDWKRHLHQVSPADAGLTVQATKDLATLPLTPWHGLGVLALWAAAALLAGASAFRFRDA